MSQSSSSGIRRESSSAKRREIARESAPCWSFSIWRRRSSSDSLVSNSSKVNSESASTKKKLMSPLCQSTGQPLASRPYATRAHDATVSTVDQKYCTAKAGGCECSSAPASPRRRHQGRQTGAGRISGGVRGSTGNAQDPARTYRTRQEGLQALNDRSDRQGTEYVSLLAASVGSAVTCSMQRITSGPSLAAHPV